MQVLTLFPDIIATLQLFGWSLLFARIALEVIGDKGGGNLTLAYDTVLIIDILYTLDSASLLVKLKPRIFQRLPPFE